MSTGNVDSPTTKEPTIVEYGDYFQASKLVKPQPDSRSRELLSAASTFTAFNSSYSHYCNAVVTSGLFMAVSTTDPSELCTDSTTQKPKLKHPVLSEGDYIGTQPR